MKQKVRDIKVHPYDLRRCLVQTMQLNANPLCRRDHQYGSGRDGSSWSFLPNKSVAHIVLFHCRCAWTQFLLPHQRSLVCSLCLLQWLLLHRFLSTRLIYSVWASYSFCRRFLWRITAVVRLTKWLGWRYWRNGNNEADFFLRFKTFDTEATFLSMLTGVLTGDGCAL